MKLIFSKRDKARFHIDYRKSLVKMIRFINRHQPLIVEKMHIQPREIVLLERSFSRKIVDDYQATSGCKRLPTFKSSAYSKRYKNKRFPIIFKRESTK